jgi:LPS sulfotransferase NodH
MRRPAAYAICGTPRSGSTLLCRLLAATGVAGAPESFFRQESLADYARRWRLPPAGDAGFDRAFLAAMRREGTGDTGIFGLRIMWPSVADAAKRLGGTGPADFPAAFDAGFGPARFIHLSRQDKLAQAISLFRARQSGLWHLAADGTVIEGVARPHPVAYDGAAIGALLEELEAHDAAWTDLFAAAGIEPLRLSYEALTAGPRAALAAILSELGRDPGLAAAAEVGTARMADRTSRLWASRFRLERAG